MYKYIQREGQETLSELAKTFPIVAITGPRQSGKTTLAQHTFPSKRYLTLEDPDIRTSAQSDPREFLSNLKEGAILDEVQRAPELFSYLQGVVDEDRRPGKFVLTGAHQFLLDERISQTLAGRAGYLKLLPFNLRNKPLLDLNERPTFIFRVVDRDFLHSDLFYICHKHFIRKKQFHKRCYRRGRNFCLEASRGRKHCNAHLLEDKPSRQTTGKEA